MKQYMVYTNETNEYNLMEGYDIEWKEHIFNNREEAWNYYVECLPDFEKEYIKDMRKHFDRDDCIGTWDDNDGDGCLIRYRRV